MNLALDLDDVVIDFTAGILQAAGVSSDRFKDIHSYDYREIFEFKPVWERVKDDTLFWLNLPPIEYIIPSVCTAYLTGRYASEQITRSWLQKWSLPQLPLYYSQDKARDGLALGFTGVVDDKAKDFEACVKVLPDSFLVSRPWNRHAITPRRIFRLCELEWRT